MARSRGPGSAPSVAPTVLSVAAALTLLNLVAGYALARATGMRWLDLPAWLPLVMVAAGIVALVVSAVSWRRYVAMARAFRQDAPVRAGPSGAEPRSTS
jgi:hypothetical protein